MVDNSTASFFSQSWCPSCIQWRASNREGRTSVGVAWNSCSSMLVLQKNQNGSC